MRKLFIIGWKDVRLVFRDRAALILMLAAPFLLTLGLGLVTGSFSRSGGSALADIPVVVVNLDKGQLGNALVDTFNSADLKDLLDPLEVSSEAQARLLIDQDKYAAAVIIPDGFTESVIPTSEMISQAQSNRQFSTQVIQVEIYSNPARPTGAGVIKAVVDEFISRVDEVRITGITSLFGMPGVEKMAPGDVEAMARKMFEGSTDQSYADTAISLKTETAPGTKTDFNPLAYMAPGMALMFLMYTVSYGGRSILVERIQGTMPRLMVSPTTSMQILGGKVFGTFLTGFLQVGILIFASVLFFQVQWGDPFGVVVLIAVTVFGATGWGLLITALARTPGQVGSLGSAIMLIFGLLGGSFISLEQLPAFIRLISSITPNAWGLDGFTILALGGTLSDLGRPIAALLFMGVTLFLLSSLIFSRSNMMKK